MDIIIGAGITGLSYANFTKNDYLIIEKDAEVGGYCKTISRNGFVWDYSGHFFHFRNKDIEELLVKRMAKDAVLKVQKKTQIYIKDRYVDFPFQKNIHQLEISDFINCLYDLVVSPKKLNADSFKSTLESKFGYSICDLFLFPYNEKLYACDLELLDTDAMGRFFPDANITEIISNFKFADNKSYNDVFTYPKNGAIEYINALLRGVDDHKIKMNSIIQSIDVQNKTIIIGNTKYQYDNLISTMPFPNLLRLCNLNFESDVYTYNKVLVFNLGFNKKGNDRVNHWVYFPEMKYRFYRIGYYDNIMNHERLSLYVEIGLKYDAAVDINLELELILQDLQKAHIISDHVLVDWHSVVMDPAYVHIKNSSLVDVNMKKNLLEQSDIYSIGRYGSWTYCSIEDNIIEAQNLVKKLNQ